MATNFKAQFSQYDTREAWLRGAESIMAQWVELEGHSYPASTRVSCGFPKSHKGRGTAIGQCWSKEASNDLTFEIFISPALSDPIDVCGTLIHEMVHATVGIENGHNAVFGKLARALGMEGKLTATTVGADLKELIELRVLPAVGPYPHAALNARDGGKVGEPKRAKTYLRKCECPECGYIAYTTAKWLEGGAPICPNDQTQMEAL